MGKYGIYTRISRIAAALIAVLLYACAVGPDYQPPETVTADHWNTPLAPQISANAADPEIMANWWRQFNDAKLTALIDQARQQGFDIRIATARLREARAAQRQAEASWFPTLTASASGARVKSSANAGSGDTNTLYQAGLDASWEPDIFGAVRHTTEAATAETEASEASLQDVQVSLAAEVALNYVNMRALQEQLRIAQRNLDSQSESEQLAQWRAMAGLASAFDAEQARATLEQTRAQVPALETALAGTWNRLAVLLGMAPGALQAELKTPAAIPLPPTTLAVGIPADTVRQRPDVRIAERTLAAATARIGVAQAARFPTLSISGSIGLEALAVGDLTDGNSATRSLMAGIAAPLFDGGALAQQVEIRDAQQQQALASYESAVLVALEDVENALVNFANIERRQTALSNAAAAARNATELARVQYESGIIDFSKLLDSQRTQLAIETSLTIATADRAVALIQLYKALGGGWRNTSGNAEDAPTS
jgi:outer membrane protein, multidrug efflux system